MSDHHPGLYARAPWLPIDEWRAWLKEQRDRYGDYEIYAFKLGVDTRRLRTWMNDPIIGAVSLQMVEKVLWTYYHETSRRFDWWDIWREDQLMDIHPGRKKKPTNGENDDNAQA